jgi:hypothetical protein
MADHGHRMIRHDRHCGSCGGQEQPENHQQRNGLQDRSSDDWAVELTFHRDGTTVKESFLVCIWSQQVLSRIDLDQPCHEPSTKRQPR